MVKHVIIWTLKPELDSEDRAIVIPRIKEHLEALKGVIPGIVELKVYTDGLASSNTDIMLDSTFENEEALKNYATHPEHVKVASRYVRPYTYIRSCFDYEV
ncbi:Dabb family protein [Butyrivibrio sp. M55]|uniref:Dabb family protein n=1 Tax=Butyrivibrio sp. M55 TaxID=1855323 RepID=UPI0008E57822|nr:Dabb family protein [Butyrivibrio sp. M55]SFU31945.1 Stress responsive A/B Barrel Domain [Butyrivibrio sp. M55]